MDDSDLCFMQDELDAGFLIEEQEFLDDMAGIQDQFSPERDDRDAEEE